MATEYDLYLKPCEDPRDSFFCDVFDRLTTSTSSASADSGRSSGSCSGDGSTSTPDSGRSTPVATFESGSPSSTERQVRARRKLATWECSCDFDAESTEFLRLDDEFDAATLTTNSSFADLDYESSKLQSCIDELDKENKKFVNATNRKQSQNEVDAASSRRPPFTITTVCLPPQPRPAARSCLLNGGAASSSMDAVSAGSALPAVDGSSSPLIHRRQLSLPANLLSLKSRRSETCLTVSRRRRFSAGVKFADEVGENLTTFAIIPSRHDENSLPKTHSAASLGRTQTPISRCPKINHFRAMASYPSAWKTSKLDERRPTPTLGSATDVDEEEDDIFDDDEVLSVACFPPLGCYRELERVTSPPQSMQATTSSSAAVSVDVPLFRLMFEQPAADPTRFRRRLDEQMICLENVKAVGGTGSTLCSIRVKTVDGGGGRRVFARCTDDEWASYADIVAQRLVHIPATTTAIKSAAHHTGAATPPGLHHHVRVFLASSGGNALPYETFSFAVQRPLDHVAAAEAATGAGGPVAGRRSRRAVEFALCYEVDDRRIFWDNNGGRNYRMEWIF